MSGWRRIVRAERTASTCWRVGLAALGLAGLSACAPIPAAAAPTPVSTPTPAKIRGAKTFAFALGAKLSGSNVARLATRDLVVVDGDEATAADVSTLRARGAIVLGYLSVGSIESWRPWFDDVEDHRLEPLDDWDGERYADVSSSALRDTYVDRVAPRILDRGFDGLFLDNVDMIESHPEQRAGMLDLVGRLSALAHGRAAALMAQNGDAIIAPYLPLLDAWNREDPTRTYDFGRKRYVATPAPDAHAAQATMRRVKAAGLLVTATDYVRPGDAKAARQAIRIACGAGAVPFVGDIGLRRVETRTPRC